MQQINKKQFMLIAAIVVVLIVVAIVLAVVGPKSGSNSPGNGPGAAAGTGKSIASSSAPVTRLPLPANVTVPEQGASSTGNVAVPQVESAAGPGSSAKYRSFNITLQNGAFSPDTVAVNQGDTVNLVITAVGGSYDFTQPDFGFNVPLPEGQGKPIQFEASASGKFIFYCSVCGGPAKGPVGYLLVAAK